MIGFRTHFADALMQSLIAHRRLDTMAYRPAIVFLNGIIGNS